MAVTSQGVVLQVIMRVTRDNPDVVASKGKFRGPLSNRSDGLMNTIYAMWLMPGRTVIGMTYK